jgi:hypothetical protein
MRAVGLRNGHAGIRTPWPGERIEVLTRSLLTTRTCTFQIIHIQECEHVNDCLIFACVIYIYMCVNVYINVYIPYVLNFDIRAAAMGGLAHHKS